MDRPLRCQDARPPADRLGYHAYQPGAAPTRLEEAIETQWTLLASSAARYRRSGPMGVASVTSGPPV